MGHYHPGAGRPMPNDFLSHAFGQLVWGDQVRAPLRGLDSQGGALAGCLPGAAHGPSRLMLTVHLCS